jgi:hypothetical protein
MSTLDEVLARYRDLAATLSRMVELAEGRAWAHLPMLDAHCSSLVHELRQMELDGLTGAQRAQLLSLAGRIRADQDALGALVQPQFQQLMRRMGELHPQS